MSGSEEENKELKKVEELRPGLRGINVKVRCKSKNEEKEVISKQTGETLRVTEALIGDESGAILITLWNDDIDKMQPDHVYKVTNSYTTVFKTSLRLNIGKYGAFEEIEEDEPKTVNEENDLSKKEYQQRPRSGFGNRFEGGGGRPRPRGDEGGRSFRGGREGGRQPFRGGSGGGGSRDRDRNFKRKF
jgi:replication factor A1